MLGSLKGFTVNFCLVVFMTAATAIAQDTVLNASDEIDRAADRFRIKSPLETQRIPPDISAHTRTHAAPYSVIRNVIASPSEIETGIADKTYKYAETDDATAADGEDDLIQETPAWIEEDLRKSFREMARFPSPVESANDRDGEDDPDDPIPAPPLDRFHWKPAIYQSLVAQGFQHGYALIFQEKTQRSLKGPFFRDYWESIKGVRGWSDGNKFFTNYIAHPMQGSMTGFIYLQNHDRLKKQIFNESAQYWKDRARALLWSTAWSTNWEIGPISQASIGNVGYYGHGGYVDLVITPTVGTAWMITEEALDRYIIRHAEKNLAARIFLRTVLNPTRSVTNLLRFKKPWYRDRAN